MVVFVAIFTSFLGKPKKTPQGRNEDEENPDPSGLEISTLEGDKRSTRPDLSNSKKSKEEEEKTLVSKS